MNEYVERPMGEPRLLVTGAGGQLGTALRAIRPSGTFLTRSELDVTDDDAVVAAVEDHRPDVIVHAAAWTKVDEAESRSVEARSVNVGGTTAVVRAASKVDAFVVYPSTDYVFAGDRRHPYDEEATRSPLSVYGRTKALAEDAVTDYARHLIVRTSWLFGEGRNFIRAILDLAANRDTLEVVGDQIGRPTYALDLAAGLLALVDRGATGTFHLAGGGEPCSWAELADAAIASAVVAAVLPRKPVVTPVTTDQYRARSGGAIAPRPRYSVLDCTKAAELGVKLRPWREAVGEYVYGLKGQGPPSGVTASTGDRP
ncbi:MAG TPA: dTDP-4-dehydrorhamnose reductase [Actinomycetota bacterium]|nr:dTDP-4-dehydrorhamnose reductase [Actinomycetota bacterium]